MKTSRVYALIFIMFLLPGGLAGCRSLETVSELGASIGVATGAITEDQARSITRSASAVARSFEDFTPEQEYYIGRSVGAAVVNRYKVYDRRGLTSYVNMVGQTVAQASTRPETFAGYHFLVLDSTEINAFAAPGGFIFVTKGMLRLCQNENDLAAVLAHEVAHVQFQHGLQAIRKSRVTSALTILAAEGARQFGGAQLAELTEAFEGSISDVVQTLTNSGYSRQFERAADEGAVDILEGVGYSPAAMIDVLERMKRGLKPGGLDFAKTHPDPDDRIADIRRAAGGVSKVRVNAAQARRFSTAMALL